MFEPPLAETVEMRPKTVRSQSQTSTRENRPSATISKLQPVLPPHCPKPKMKAVAPPMLPPGNIHSEWKKNKTPVGSYGGLLVTYNMNLMKKNMTWELELRERNHRFMWTASTCELRVHVNQSRTWTTGARELQALVNPRFSWTTGAREPQVRVNHRYIWTNVHLRTLKSLIMMIGQSLLSLYRCSLSH